jgi:hypothetical protein
VTEPDVLPAVREGQRRGKIKERIGYASVAFAMIATIVAIVTSLPHRPAPLPPTSRQRPAPVPTVPAGYRIESSLGLQIAVPDAWQTNDFGCGQDARPTVVRGQGIAPGCLTPTPDAKEFALIETSAFAPNPDALLAIVGANLNRIKQHHVTIGGVAAVGGNGPLGDGRFAGWILVPARHIIVIARTDSQATLASILASARLVSIDHFGCRTAAPPAQRPAPAGGTTFVGPSPTAVTVCYYAGADGGGRLQASTQRTGSAAVSVATAFNAANDGSNPDHPERCTHSTGPQPIDAVLLFGRSDGTVQEVTATFQMCVGVHLDNGRQYRQLTQKLIELIMAGTDAGYTTVGS